MPSGKSRANTSNSRSAMRAVQEPSVASGPTANALPPADVWNDIACQDRAVQELKGTIINPKRMINSWLFYGPSQSFALALAYASALLSPNAMKGEPTGDKETHSMVSARTHPDLRILTTENVTVPIREIRELVMKAQLEPSLADKTVFIVEDLTRVPRRSLNVLLKPLEEPHAHVVWILCAPSIRGVTPTIRSRLRAIYLNEPSIENLAGYLTERRGIEKSLACEISYASLGNVDDALYLVDNESTRLMRKKALDLVFCNRDLAEAVCSAQTILDLVSKEAESVVQKRDLQLREGFLKNFAFKQGDVIPKQLQHLQPRRDNKQQVSRQVRDALDGIFLSCLSVCRDVLAIKSGATNCLYNPGSRILDKLSSMPPEKILRNVKALEYARDALKSNVMLLLLLESILVQMVEM